MQKIIWTRGLPASGKTTWAKDEIAKSGGHTKRVNKDDLRAMLDNSVWSKPNENFMLTIRDEIIRKALLTGRSVISDDTNFEPKHEARFKELAEEYQKATGKPCQVEQKDFTDVPVLECIKRDALRTGTAQVGEKVILSMYNRYLKVPPAKYTPPVENLPRCLICDLDGTLALLNGRDPYDATNCDKDLLNEPVAEMVNLYLREGVVDKVIFLSGREGKYRGPTVHFLEGVAGKIPAEYELYMRNTGDSRKDAIIKRELFDQYIHGRFNPILWLDDRQQVVDMVRKELGIPLFQVAEGLF